MATFTAAHSRALIKKNLQAHWGMKAQMTWEAPLKRNRSGGTCNYYKGTLLVVWSDGKVQRQDVTVSKDRESMQTSSRR